MAKKKINWWLWGGLAAVAYYLYSTSTASAAPPAAVAPAPPLPVPLTPAQPPALPINTAIVQPPTPPAAAMMTPSVMIAPTVLSPSASPVQANPAPLIATGPIGPGEVTDAGVPYDPRMATLQTWASTTLNTCDLARWNNDQTNFTAAEWAGLFDLYFNDWIGGQGNNAQRTAFWNAWRNKYQILTQTPC
jgi:hypothetical protein